MGRSPEVQARRPWLAVVVVLGVVVADQATKAWVVTALSRRPQPIVGTTVELRLSRNSGSAFSFLRGTGFTPLLAVIALAVAVVLVRLVRRADNTWMVVALSLVLGGAVGNLCDRMFRAPGVLRGAVVDFVRVGWWPSFNVADAAITVGVLLLVVLVGLGPRRAERGRVL